MEEEGMLAQRDALRREPGRQTDFMVGSNMLCQRCHSRIGSYWCLAGKIGRHGGMSEIRLGRPGPCWF